MLVAMVVLVMGMLAGCSFGKTSDGSEGGAQGELGGGNEGKAVSGTLEIQYFVGGYGDAWWKAVIKDFQAKYPEVDVKQYAGPNINKEMKTRWISNNPPDVVYIDGAGASETQMVEDGQLMDLSEWINTVKLPDGTPLKDSFIVPPSKYDGGKIFSLPLVFDTWGTWYDKNWFEKEGFDVPKDFPSWMASMQEIKEKAGIAPFVTTGKYPYYFLRGVLYPAIAAAGGDELLNAVIDGEKGAWTSDKVLGVMKKVQQMQEKGFIDPGFAALSHTQSQMNFLLHKNAYIPVGFWLPNEMAKDVPDDFQFGFIPSPMNEPGEPMVIVPDLRPLAIAKKAENPEAAKAFVQFVFQKKYASKFAELTGAMMNMKGVDLSSNPKVPDYLKDANEMINNPDKVAIHHKNHPMGADLETPISNALVSLLLGKIDAEQFCQKAEQAAEKYRNNK
ncbi:MAG TPA: ABC transporter substrate-binding protein [Bacillales bacterium]|nr:ABC transporter substrate-binding protein [Bacillales bacterium]